MTAIDHPRHYCSHSSNVECIDIKEELPSNVGDALKYSWRLGLKDLEPLERGKCVWYLRREATRLAGGGKSWPLTSATIALVVKAHDHESVDTALFQILDLILHDDHVMPAELLRVAASIELGGVK